MATYAEMLANARTALDAIVSGQVESYTISGGPNGGQTVKRHNLGELRRHIEWLESRAATAAGATMTQSLSFGGTE